MKALVTGHKGYIGGNLIKELRSKGYTIAGIDLKECEINGVKFPGTNICDEIPIEFYEYSPDIIFHLAAIPRVGYSVQKPVEVMENNIELNEFLKMALNIEDLEVCKICKSTSNLF